MDEGAAYTFNIINFRKRSSLYSYGKNTCNGHCLVLDLQLQLFTIIIVVYNYNNYDYINRNETAHVF